MPSLYAPVNRGIGRPHQAHRAVLLFALLLVALTFLGGCQSLNLTPRGEYAATAQAYGEALNAAARLGLSGRLSADDAQAIEDARAVARTALDQADAVLTDSRRPQTDARFWTARAQGAISIILTVISRYEAHP